MELEGGQDLGAGPLQNKKPQHFYQNFFFIKGERFWLRVPRDTFFNHAGEVVGTGAGRGAGHDTTPLFRTARV